MCFECDVLETQNKDASYGLWSFYCVYMVVGVCTCAMVQTWQSEHNLLEPILFYHVVIRDLTQGARLDGKLLYALIHPPCQPFGLDSLRPCPDPGPCALGLVLVTAVL